MSGRLTPAVLIKVLSTFFFMGYLPFIPGTFGSLAGLGLYLAIHSRTCIYVVALVSLLGIGFLVSGQAEKLLRKKDHRAIVIDEVCGMLIALVFLPYDPKFIVIGFFLFRLLDIIKPYPGNILQDFQGSIGIMGDDIVAGIYVNIILQIVSKVG